MSNNRVVLLAVSHLLQVRLLPRTQPLGQHVEVFVRIVLQQLEYVAPGPLLFQVLKNLQSLLHLAVSLRWVLYGTRFGPQFGATTVSYARVRTLFKLTRVVAARYPEHFGLRRF